ncbi:unnamed protein product [Darwinula stevensoni]|uniref:Peptidoglycan recognition protein family domain-containing protein n=1 Tax=Darwinula stevensoni TaxID=69355 RepID=A0A7R8XEW4_9CRUS|nr:unnamed protein product [Darwinula stevensoni]CAG0895687.1 unnamed protein product [Darwinula stevensoni]
MFSEEKNIRVVDGKTERITEDREGIFAFLKNNGMGKHVLVDEVPLTLGIQGHMDERSIEKHWEEVFLLKDHVKSLTLSIRPNDSTYTRDVNLQNIRIAGVAMDVLTVVKRNTRFVSDLFLALGNYSRRVFVVLEPTIQDMEFERSEKELLPILFPIPSCSTVHNSCQNKLTCEAIRSSKAILTLMECNTIALGKIVYVVVDNRERRDRLANILPRVCSKIVPSVKFIDSSGKLREKEATSSLIVVTDDQIRGYHDDSIIILDLSGYKWRIPKRLQRLQRLKATSFTVDVFPGEGRALSPERPLLILSYISLRIAVLGGVLSSLRPREEKNIRVVDGKTEGITEDREGIFAFLKNNGMGKHVLVDEVPLTLGIQGHMDEQSIEKHWEEVFLLKDHVKSLTLSIRPNDSTYTRDVNLQNIRIAGVAMDVLTVVKRNTRFVSDLFLALGNYSRRIFVGLEPTIQDMANSTEDEIENWKEVLNELKREDQKLTLTVVFQSHSRGGREISMKDLASFFQTQGVQVIKHPGFKPIGNTSNLLLRHLCMNETRTRLRLEVNVLPTASRTGALVHGFKPRHVTLKYNCPGQHLGKMCFGQKYCMPYLGAFRCFRYTLSQKISGEQIYVLASDRKLISFLMWFDKRHARVAENMLLVFVHPEDFRGCESSVSIVINVDDHWLLESISRSRTNLFVIDCLPHHREVWSAMKEEGRLDILEMREDDECIDEEILFKLNACGNFLGVSPRFVTREEWEARRPKSTTDMKTPVPFVVISHTATLPCFNINDSIRMVKEIQDEHMDTNKWDDIAYRQGIVGVYN